MYLSYVPTRASIGSPTRKKWPATPNLDVSEIVEYKDRPVVCALSRARLWV